MHTLYISFESIFYEDFEFNASGGHLRSCEVKHNTELCNKGMAVHAVFEVRILNWAWRLPLLFKASVGYQSLDLMQCIIISFTFDYGQIILNSNKEKNRELMVNK